MPVHTILPLLKTKAVARGRANRTVTAEKRDGLYSTNRKARARPGKYRAVPHVHVATTFWTRGRKKTDAGEEEEEAAAAARVRGRDNGTKEGTLYIWDFLR